MGILQQIKILFHPWGRKPKPEKITPYVMECYRREHPLQVAAGELPTQIQIERYRRWEKEGAK